MNQSKVKKRKSVHYYNKLTLQEKTGTKTTKKEYTDKEINLHKNQFT